MESKTELFTITCTSCAAKLKVRNESAIGQVLSCPRCQSMVLVEAPKGWHAKGGVGIDANDSQTNIEGDRSNIEEAAIVPSSQWDSASSKKRQKLTLLIACGALILVAMITAGVFIVNQFNGTTAKADPSDTGLNTDSVDPDKENPFKEKSQQNTDSDSSDSAPENTETNNTADSIEDSDNGGNRATDKTDTNKTDTDPSESVSSAESTDTANQKNPETAGTENSNPTIDNSQPGNEKEIPFDLNPAEKNSDEKTDNRSLLDKIGGVDGIFIEDAPVVSQQNPEAADPFEGIGIGALYIPKPLPMEGDPAEQMSVHLTGIKFDSIRAIDFIRFVSDLSGTPVTFDIENIRADGIDLTQTIVVLNEDLTVGQILTENLKPLNLQYSVVPAGILITTVDSESFAYKTHALPIAISASDSESTTRFMENLQSAVVPESWSVNGGEGLLEMADGQLRIYQKKLTHHKIERFIYKLDIAKKLADSPNDPALIEQAKSKYKHVHEKLASKTTYTAADPRPIEEVFAAIANDMKLTIVLDWQSLFPLGWNPNTEIAWSNAGKTFGESLNEIVSSMNIGYRWIDQTTLEITSRDKIRSSLEIEVYSIKPLIAEDQTDQKVMAIVEKTISAIIPRDSAAAIVYEPKCHAIVGLLPQSIHTRLQELLTLLEKPSKP
jgi:hypothetical protein